MKLHSSHRNLNNQLLKNFTICSHWSGKTEAFFHVTTHDIQNVTEWEMLSPCFSLSYLLWWFLMKTWAVQTKERGGDCIRPPPATHWALASVIAFCCPGHGLASFGQAQLLFWEAASETSQSICLLFMGWCFPWCWQLS